MLYYYNRISNTKVAVIRVFSAKISVRKGSAYGLVLNWIFSVVVGVFRDPRFDKREITILLTFVGSRIPLLCPNSL